MTTEKENPLFLAVIHDDFDRLQSLLKPNDESANAVDKGSPLLFATIKHERVEMFDYLLSFDNIDVNCLDHNEQQTPLQFLIARKYRVSAESNRRHFIFELVKKGADVPGPDYYGSTFLHEAAKYFTAEDGPILEKLLYEKGLDVNACDWDGITPLQLACRRGYSDYVYMLLHHGADATIPNHKGELPLVSVSRKLPINEQLQMQDILFNLTFDDEKTTIDFATLVNAMTFKTPLFWKILRITDCVRYDVEYLDYLDQVLIYFQPEHFRLFLHRFRNLVKLIIPNFPLLKIMIISPRLYELDLHSAGELESIHIYSARSKDMIKIFFQSDLTDHDFIQAISPTKSTIHNFIFHMYKLQCPIKEPEEEEEVTEIVCRMLMYGLTVTYADLWTVYERYGFCELFKILLHMDIDAIDFHSFCKQMISLYIDPSTDVTDLDFGSLPYCVLEYYNHPEIKEFFIDSGDEEKAAKAKSLPSVPLLLELSRNVARKYIMSRYNIKNCRHFYTILNWLPIGEMNKSIIALERKLY